MKSAPRETKFIISIQKPERLNEDILKHIQVFIEVPLPDRTTRQLLILNSLRSDDTLE
jgi:hypothetical protein